MNINKTLQTEALIINIDYKRSMVKLLVKGVGICFFGLKNLHYINVMQGLFLEIKYINQFTRNSIYDIRIIGLINKKGYLYWGLLSLLYYLLSELLFEGTDVDEIYQYITLLKHEEYISILNFIYIIVLCLYKCGFLYSNNDLYVFYKEYKFMESVNSMNQIKWNHKDLIYLIVDCIECNKLSKKVSNIIILLTKYVCTYEL
jgi:hypothetical protein